MKTCSKCKEQKDLFLFSPTKRNPDGSVKYRHSWCNPCRVTKDREVTGRKKKVFAIVDEEAKLKQCNECKEVLCFSQFSPSARGSAGLAAYCKVCAKAKYYDKEKARKTTQKYRDTHRLRWRALHRVHQFNRKALIKAASDGTVTDEVLRSIYESEICFWCKCFIDTDQRTLEHIVELSNGGEHSVDNITMACRSCNSARLNKENTYNAN